MRNLRICAAACALALCLTACGGSASSVSASSTAETASAASSESEGGLSVDKNLFNVTLTYPASMVEEGTTQESLNEEIKGEKGIKSATLNEDGSVTYVMTKAYHREIVQEMENSIKEDLAAMVGSEDYPNFTDVQANDDFTSFTVTTTSTSLDLMESFSVLQFYLEGGLYGVISGNNPDNIHVEFVNAETGEIIQSADSSDANNAQ